MSDYKRLTEKLSNGICKVKCNEKCERFKDSQEVFCAVYEDCNYAAVEYLAKLEDKIENGTLIEMPRIIHPTKLEWFVQYQYPNGIIHYCVCFSEAEAEKKLKELRKGK